MRCMSCKGEMVSSLTIDVTEREGMIIIIKNVPCYKCTECDDVFYTGNVLAQLEQLRERAEKMLTELAVIDYNRAA